MSPPSNSHHFRLSYSIHSTRVQMCIHYSLFRQTSTWQRQRFIGWWDFRRMNRWSNILSLLIRRWTPTGWRCVNENDENETTLDWRFNQKKYTQVSHGCHSSCSSEAVRGDDFDMRSIDRWLSMHNVQRLQWAIRATDRKYKRNEQLILFCIGDTSIAGSVSVYASMRNMNER